jgi:mycothiol synthase
MESSMLCCDHDIEAMRDLLKRLSTKSTVVDFEEQMLLASVRATTRIWRQDNQVVGFAYVDDYNNLWFDTENDSILAELESELIEWGVVCIKRRNAETGAENSMDFACRADYSLRIEILRKHGFTQQPVRSLHYARSLSEPLIEAPFPAGFSFRCVAETDSIEQLVGLHRAAFGTDYMTVEERLAIMSVPKYVRTMDLVAVAPNHELAAFCICGFLDLDKKIGYTDPIGTHPRYQKIGLGKALVTAGLAILKDTGANIVELGTSSDNIAMQKLAAGLGFVCISEKLWFSKAVA